MRYFRAVGPASRRGELHLLLSHAAAHGVAVEHTAVDVPLDGVVFLHVLLAFKEDQDDLLLAFESLPSFSTRSISEVVYMEQKKRFVQF